MGVPKVGGGGGIAWALWWDSAGMVHYQAIFYLLAVLGTGVPIAVTTVMI